MADWGGLENRCGLMGHRGFESHPLRSSSYCSPGGIEKPDDFNLSGFSIPSDRDNFRKA